MDMSTTNNDFTNTTQSALNLVDLNNDVLTLICEHLDMRDACNLYRTGSKNLREAIANTKFDFYEKCCYNSSVYYWYIPEGVSVKKFRSVFTSAIGIRIYRPYELTDEDFDYMVPKNFRGEPLKGVKIDLSCYNDHPIKRGAKYHKNAFTKLEGVHTLNILNNKFVKYRHLKSLHNIETLSMRFIQIQESILQYFTKIKFLDIEGCYQMTNKALTYLKSKNLECLNVRGCNKITVPALREFCSEYKIDCYGPAYLVDLDE
jgi:hypothetical protein